MSVQLNNEENMDEFVAYCQSLSKSLKATREESHPERSLGCKRTNNENDSNLLNSLDHIPTYLLQKAQVLIEPKVKPFVQFFYLSLLLDFLKSAHKLEFHPRKNLLSDIQSYLINHLTIAVNSKSFYASNISKIISILYFLLTNMDIIDRSLFLFISECRGKIHELLKNEFSKGDVASAEDPTADRCFLIDDLNRCSEPLLASFVQCNVEYCYVTLRVLLRLRDSDQSSTKYDSTALGIIQASIYAIMRDTLVEAASCGPSRVVELLAQDDKVLVNTFLRLAETQLLASTVINSDGSKIIASSATASASFSDSSLTLSPSIITSTLESITQVIQASLSESSLDIPSTFVAFVKDFARWDAVLVVDLISSSETSSAALSYLLRATKFVGADLTGFQEALIRNSRDKSNTFTTQRTDLSNSVQPLAARGSVVVWTDDSVSPVQSRVHGDMWRRRPSTTHSTGDANDISSSISDTDSMIDFLEQLAKQLTALYGKKILTFNPSLLTSRLSTIKHSMKSTM